MPIAVLGAGAWGTALAIVLARNGNTVHLWDIDQAHIDQMLRTGSNNSYLPTIKLPDLIKPIPELSEALNGTQDILMVPPSHAFIVLLNSILSFLSDQHRIAWATKGLDSTQPRLLTDAFNEITESKYPSAIISGPSFAKEVAEGKPTHVTLASQDVSFSNDLYQAFCNKDFQLEITDDITGVQLCGALKNVLAIAIGISDGLGFGANARCALMTKGLAQMTALGDAMGARKDTFTSFAGLGDMILTCTDNQSRNRRFGFALGESLDTDAAEKAVNQTIEGKETTKNAYQLIQTQNVNCPFIEQMYQVIYEYKSARDAIEAILLQ